MENSSIINLWIDDLNKPVIEPHSHNWNEIIYFNKGKVLTHIGENTYEVDRGTFVIIPKKVRHDEKRFEDTQTICLIFTSDKPVKHEIFTDSSGEILDHLLAMNKEARTKPYKFKEVLDYKFRELCIMLERMRAAKKTFSKDFGYAISFISDNYRGKIDFPALAKGFNMSYSYFRHRFKEITGFPPQTFLIKRRLEQARKMLIKGELNCTETAYYCGFSNSAQFTDMFKREFGIAPAKYRQMNK